MAKKTTTPKAPTTKLAAPKTASVSTPVRNTPIPKETAPKAKAVSAPVTKSITHADIALRALEISRSGSAGDEMSNWLTAERELRGV